MSRIKTKKQGVVNSLVWTQQDNDTATISFDGTDFDISDPTTFASTVNLANGTAAAPSLTFTNSTGVGLYRNASNVLGIATAGTERVTLDASGNLSILTPGLLKTTTNVGTVGAATVSAVTYGDGRDMTTVLTLTDFVVGALAGAGAALGVGNIVYAFPSGAHIELTSYMSVSLKCAGTAVNTDTGLGSVIASGAVNVLSGTATFEDRHTGQTIPTAAAGGAVTTSMVNTTAGVLTGIALNVAASVKNVFLNSAGTWNANNTGNLTATGTIVLRWTKMA